MQERKVIMTCEAIYDIIDIAEHIEINFGMARADRFQDDIRQQMRKLQYLGGVFGKTCVFYRGYTIYMMPFSPSIIFYVIKEPENEIHVLRVLREERDWEAILTQKQEYTYP